MFSNSRINNLGSHYDRLSVSGGGSSTNDDFGEQKAPVADNRQAVAGDRVSLSTCEGGDTYFSRMELDYDLGCMRDKLRGVEDAFECVKNSHVFTAQEKLRRLGMLSNQLGSLSCEINDLSVEKASIYRSDTPKHVHLDRQIEQKNNQIRNINHLVCSSSSYVACSEFIEANRKAQQQLQQEIVELKAQKERQSRIVMDLLYREEPLVRSLVDSKHCIENSMSEYRRYLENYIYRHNYAALEEKANTYKCIIEELEKQKSFVNDAYINVSKAGGGSWQRFYTNVLQEMEKYLVAARKKQAYSQNKMREVIPCDTLLFSDEKSRYGRVCTISFKHVNILEPKLIQDEAFHRHYFRQKGVECIHQYRANIESVEQAVIEPSLREMLSTILSDEVADGPRVKPTKIIVELHGTYSTKLSATSFGANGYASVSAHQMGDYLAKHLPCGDYKGKLTIMMMSCGSAQKWPKLGVPEGESGLECIADLLKQRHYTGIKLTASKGLVFTGGPKVGEGVMGMVRSSDLYHHDLKVKFSRSENKVAISI